MIDGGQQFVRIRVNKAFDFVAEESGFKKGLENSFLRNKFVADCVTDRLREFGPMPGNHSLRPDRDTEEFDRLVRMKQHPNRQPSRAIAVQGGDDDDRHADQNLEGDWIDGRRTSTSLRAGVRM